ncbi:MAG: NADH:flavin oxidoreductase, partial [Deltaproteobacteria bacterium]|nr:NADH:flavin oxidoreductase [Deltaproteobacteria bacterium]
MSLIFSPGKLGSVEIKNRLVHSATYECMAAQDGQVTDQLVKRYGTLARGGIGLIIPGHLYVHPDGKAMHKQTAIHSDEMIPGLNKIAREVQQYEGRVIFQLAHAGRQTRWGQVGKKPMGPSRGWRDPISLTHPREMTQEDIQAVIDQFKKAGTRAMEAGADGVQLHAAHGYLINQFLSPFFNRRKDSWGGTDEKRFRFLDEILLVLRKVLPTGAPLLVKLNTHDHTPRRGITLALAAYYAQRLVEREIDGVEISSGTASYSFMNTCRGKVQVNGFAEAFPRWVRPFFKMILKTWNGKYELDEPYHIDAAKIIKPILGRIPLLIVGGLRRVSQMDDVLEHGYADFISMSRPFIREPLLANAMKEGKTDHAACDSCNACLA